MEKQRNSNFEFLRIIAMVMIFWGHGMWRGGVQNASKCISTRLAGDLMGSGARISVTIFLLISAWFMIDMEYKAKRILDIWLTTVFYVVLFNVIGYCFVPDSSIFALLTSPLPLSFWQLWYPSAYIIWLLFMPILKSICEKLSDRRMLQFIVLHLIFFVIQSSYLGLQDTHIVIIAWFNFLYFFVWFLKKNTYSPIKREWYKKMKAKWILGAGIVLYFIFALAVWVFYNYEMNVAGINVSAYMYKLLRLWVTDYKVLPNFLIALLIFLGVTGIKPHYCKNVNRAAKGVFAIYCVHEVTLFKEFFWNEILDLDYYRDLSVVKFVLYVLSVTVLFFGCVMVFDLFRSKWLHRQVVKTKIYNWLCGKMDMFIKED